MSLRNLFKFRELPESETSKPFLEHLEDLRWVLIKSSVTIFIAMLLCMISGNYVVGIINGAMRLSRSWETAV